MLEYAAAVRIPPQNHIIGAWDQLMNLLESLREKYPEEASSGKLDLSPFSQGCWQNRGCWAAISARIASDCDSSPGSEASITIDHLAGSTA